MRVVIAHHLADHAGALEEPAVGPVPAVVHRVQDADVNRLEPIPDVGERTADDDRHRVVDVAALHLVLDVDRLGAVVPATRGISNFGHLAIPTSQNETSWPSPAGQMSRNLTSFALRVM